MTERTEPLGAAGGWGFPVATLKRGLGGCLLVGLCLAAAPAPRDLPSHWEGVPLIDLAHETHRQVTVDREPGQYLGHPTTQLLDDGRTLLAVYPKGHGKGPIVYKRSPDGGLSWSDRLTVPDSWATSQEVPTLFKTGGPEGTRLILFSGLYPIRRAISDDEGATWSELEPIGDFGGIVAMSSLHTQQNGDLLAFFHDDGRFLRDAGETSSFQVFATRSSDQGVTWSDPWVVTEHPAADLCEPGLVVSPDGRRLALLLRENSRTHPSFVVFSDDDGATWTQPRELPAALTGDRHTASYAPDGRLVVTFRDMADESPTKGDWVLWVGSWADLEEGASGQLRARVMDNTNAWDAAYPGLNVLPDGAFVTTTYGHWTEGEEPYVVSVRFRMEELDAAVAERTGLPLPISTEEYRSRRDRLMAALDGGITVLHAQPSEKAMEQWGFVQDPSFLYFTGLSDLTGAILALDAPAEEVHLFLPPAPESFGFPVEGLVPPPGPATAEELAVTSVVRWDGFSGWLDRRLEDGVTTLFVDGPRRPEATGVPPGMAATAGPRQLWRASLEDRFPSARFESAKEAIHTLRWVKSPAEVDALRTNAEATVHALKAAAQQMSPGMRQREGEALVVSACIEAGAQGPSFWPWLMSGPNARVGRLVHAFFRYDQLDRTMNAGELVRVDIGCAGGLYGADVGRTLPVSGTFSEGQREAWDLLIEGYLAGIQVMADGVTVDSVRAASVQAIRAAALGLTTPTGRGASEAILAGGTGVWHMHGVGIESGEDAAPVLRAGSVIAFEPGFELGPDAYYLEDMILITSEGAEVLSVDLPHDAAGIESMMRQR